MNIPMKKIIVSIALIFCVVIGYRVFLNLSHNEQISSTNTGQSSHSNIIHASLRLKWLFDPGFAGEMVAVKKGFFRDNGIDLEIKPGGFESDPIKLVASGSDTIGVAGADSFLLAREKGIPIVAFAAGYLQTAVVYYVHADSGINSPKDFVGKRVGYQGGQDTATIYEALMKQLGVDRRGITEVPVKYDFTPFLTGQVDVWPGYAATQSYILQQKNIPYKVFKPSDYGLSFLGTVYFTTEKVVKENPELIQEFVNGLVKGWEFTYSNYDSAIPMIEAYDQKTLTPELIRFNLDKQKPSILPEGMQFCRFTPEQWETAQKILLDQTLLETPIDLSQAVTTKFLDSYYSKHTAK